MLEIIIYVESICILFLVSTIINLKKKPKHNKPDTKYSRKLIIYDRYNKDSIIFTAIGTFELKVSYNEITVKCLTAENECKPFTFYNTYYGYYIEQLDEIDYDEYFCEVIKSPEIRYFNESNKSETS